MKSLLLAASAALLLSVSGLPAMAACSTCNTVNVPVTVTPTIPVTVSPSTPVTVNGAPITNTLTSSPSSRARAAARASANPVVNNNVSANSYYPSRQTIRTTGQAYAPAIAIGGEDTCVGVVSGGGGLVGFAASLGFSVPLADCNRRRYAMLLMQAGRTQEAITLLTFDPEVNRAFRLNAEAQTVSGPLYQTRAIYPVYRERVKKRFKQRHRSKTVVLRRKG